MLKAKLLGATAAAGPEGAWDLSYAHYDETTGNPWDMSTANTEHIGNFSVSAQEVTPQDVFFKSDGSVMYVLGKSSDGIYHYDLSIPWAVVSAVYNAAKSTTTTGETNPEGMFISPDGLNLYVTGTTGDDVNQYTLSTAWDVSTQSLVRTFYVGSQRLNPSKVFFKTDGTQMYITSSSSYDVFVYNLSTPWNISTCTYVNSYSVGAVQTATPDGVYISPDGFNLYVVDSTNSSAYQYSLSTPWDVSTFTFVQSFATSSATNTPFGIYFKPSGEKMYIVGNTSAGRVGEYSLGGFDAANQEILPTGLSFSQDGTKMYVTGTAGDDINQYSLSTPWDVSTATYVQVGSVAGQDTAPQGLFFKPDGTKMYMVGDTGNDVNEYSLNTAWDVASASYVRVFSVASQATTPTGISFKSDGTKMYVTGGPGTVNEYSLSTAWDISTASFVSTLSVTAQDITIGGVFFRPNGTKMYLIGATNDGVYEYSLSTPWSISTAAYTKKVTVPSDPDLTDLFFKPDGTMMFVLGRQFARVHPYQISLQS